MKDDELKAIFLAEAQGNCEDLNRLFTQLEKNHHDKASIASIFRITHTLKANAAAMGFDGIANLAHVLEDIFSLIKEGKMVLNEDIFNTLFRANDKLGDLVASIKTEKKVSFRGILTKLRVILREANEQTENPETTEPQQDSNTTDGQEEESPEAEDAPQNSNISFSDFVQVPVDKLDQLMNLVGELAIERDRLITQHLIKTGGRSSNEYASLYRISSDLQYAVMSARLVKVKVLFNKFFRIVRDVASFEQKQVDLVLQGTEIEIDRNVLQTISDSLIHLVRNAVSHGLETPEQRTATGKTSNGTLLLRAKNDRDAVAIDIQDDGNGIDAKIIQRKAIEKGIITAEQAIQMSEQEIVELIFAPGFSSRDSVTEVSGRGVGMDVVKKAIDSIGGEIVTTTTVGKGTTFTLYLPASMAVKKALLFQVGESNFAIPLSFIDSVIQLQKEDVHKVGKGLVGTYSNETISMIFLRDLFTEPENGDTNPNFHHTFSLLDQDSRFHVVLINLDGKKVGFVVDKLIQQKEIIEKPLTGTLKNSKYISGATILGDGSVCLVLDVSSINRQVFRNVTPSNLANTNLE